MGTGAPDTDWTHGSVLALNNAHPDWTRWGATAAVAPEVGNSFVEGVDTDLYTFYQERRMVML